MRYEEPRFLKPLSIGITFIFLGLFVVLPLGTIFSEALSEGVQSYTQALREQNTLKAINLTLLCALIVVPLNTFFGIALAYGIAKFNFRFKTLLTTLIDLPFAISPAVAGLMLVLLFGSSGLLGEILQKWDIKIIFAFPGIILASAFVTFPFVAKELIPLMQQQGTEEEEAALSLGANGWQTFFRVTLPNIKWGLFYGAVPTNARAMGEFGAVAVVSGKFVGITTTMPIYIEILYNEYLYVSAFCIASLFVLLSVVTLILKGLLEYKKERV